MFRFTIRDVLWLMVVVAVVITWQIDRRGAAKRYNDLLTAHRLISPRSVDWDREWPEARKELYP